MGLSNQEAYGTERLRHILNNSGRFSNPIELLNAVGFVIDPNWPMSNETMTQDLTNIFEATQILARKFNFKNFSDNESMGQFIAGLLVTAGKTLYRESPINFERIMIASSLPEPNELRDQFQFLIYKQHIGPESAGAWVAVVAQQTINDDGPLPVSYVYHLICVPDLSTSPTPTSPLDSSSPASRADQTPNQV